MEQNNKLTIKSKLKLLIPVVLIVAIVLLTLNVLSPDQPVGDGSHQVEFEVAKGSGASSVTRHLYEEGLINDQSSFRWFLRITNRADKLKAGVYSLNNGMSIPQIADILTEGKTKLVSITIPEGWTNRQIGDYLTDKKFVESRAEFLNLTRDRKVLDQFGILDQTTEGYLFPDTYMIPPGYDAKKIQLLMLKRFFKVLEEIMTKKNLHPGSGELRRFVILASIVEREAVKAQERPMMARVFLNRLDKGMRLESCATIQYLFDKPKPRIYNKDLEIVSPYNTYRNKGLPPGPISNPGRAALEATFNPLENQYLYFVLKEDGSHSFSKTYNEHLRAKKQYLNY